MDWFWQYFTHLSTLFFMFRTDELFAQGYIYSSCAFTVLVSCTECKSSRSSILLGVSFCMCCQNNILLTSNWVTHRNNTKKYICTKTTVEYKCHKHIQNLLMIRVIPKLPIIKIQNHRDDQSHPEPFRPSTWYQNAFDHYHSNALQCVYAQCLFKLLLESKPDFMCTQRRI